jgi:predicted aspartyl protease
VSRPRPADRPAPRAALAVGWCALAACQPAPSRIAMPADSAAGEVAFDLAGPADAALVVPVHVNGEGPFDFILDTGATITCVADSTAVRLGLQERPMSGGVGVGVGGTGRLRLATVDSVRLGEARAYDLPVCLVDLSQTRVLGTEVHGLLGLNFLKPYRVTLDFERRVVRLQGNDAGETGDAAREGGAR